MSETKIFRRNAQRPGRTRKGFSLVEAMFGIFIALMCVLIIAGALPIANRSRSKAEKANIALALAQKQMESVRMLGFPNAVASQAHSNGLLDSAAQLDLQTAMAFGATPYPAYECTWVDTAKMDSAGNLLPNGRAFMTFSEINDNLRAVEVFVFWREGTETRFVKLATLVANL